MPSWNRTLLHCYLPLHRSSGIAAKTADQSANDCRDMGWIAGILGASTLSLSAPAHPLRGLHPLRCTRSAKLLNILTVMVSGRRDIAVLVFLSQLTVPVPYSTAVPLGTSATLIHRGHRPSTPTSSLRGHL